uniref:Uncharacterized protein n=1 Tax=Anopheles funestus TaxID=62324 RepID=A0A4Y0BFE8_ANOFN
MYRPSQTPHLALSMTWTERFIQMSSSQAAPETGEAKAIGANDDEAFGYLKRVIVTPAVYPRLLEFLHVDIQSTGQKSHCVNTQPGPSQCFVLIRQSDSLHRASSELAVCCATASMQLQALSTTSGTRPYPAVPGWSHSAFRANPFPEVTDPVCRLPLPTLIYRLEALHLGDLLRIRYKLLRVHIYKRGCKTLLTHQQWSVPQSSIFMVQEECIDTAVATAVLYQRVQPYLSVSDFHGRWWL